MENLESFLQQLFRSSVVPSKIYHLVCHPMGIESIEHASQKHFDDLYVSPVSQAKAPTNDMRSAPQSTDRQASTRRLPLRVS